MASALLAAGADPKRLSPSGLGGLQVRVLKRFRVLGVLKSVRV